MIGISLTTIIPKSNLFILKAVPFPHAPFVITIWRATTEIPVMLGTFNPFPCRPLGFSAPLSALKCISLPLWLALAHSFFTSSTSPPGGRTSRLLDPRAHPGIVSKFACSYYTGRSIRCVVWGLVMVSFPPCDSPRQVVVITRLSP